MAVETINGCNFGHLYNPKAKNEFFEHVVDYNKTTSGAFRFLQLIEKMARAASMVFKEMDHYFTATFEDISRKLGTAIGMFALPRLPALTRDAWKAITSLGDPSGGIENSKLRGFTKKIHDIADCVATWMHAISALFNIAPLRNAADVPGVVADTAQLTMAGEDYVTAGRYLKKADPDKGLVRRFSDTQTEALIRLVKSVASVSSGVLGLLALAFGAPLLPAVALLGLSTTSTVAAMAAHFFKETRPEEIVQFFDSTPKLVVSGDNDYDQVY